MTKLLKFHRRTRLLVLSAALLFATIGSRAIEAADPVAETLPEGIEISGIEVFPTAIELDRPFAYRQVLVTGRLADGEQVDLTRLSSVEAPSGIVEISPNRRVTARQDGTGEIVVRHGAHEARIAVEIRGQTSRYEASYIRDVQPILSRVGCNQGTCHGSQNGKNGFKLSLRGNDYLFDHQALTDDLAGRRFNRAAPDRSLFLMKTSGGIPHTGGVVVDTSDDYYRILRSWVADGVRFDETSARVETIEIYPKKAVLPLPGMRQQFAVLATYTDGSVRDVSAEAFVETNNIEVTEVDRRGVVTAIRRGECAILARYEGRYAATQLFVMGDRSGWEWKDVEEYNYIDTHVYRKLRAIKGLPSGIASDAEFLRRAYLDLTGLPPTSREVTAYLRDRRDPRKKREELVDRLIGSVEFVEYWTNKWSDLLQVNPKWLGTPGTVALREWIAEAIASNKPYDRFVNEVLTASGSTLANPPAAYYKVLREPESVMENTTQLFLGIRFSCNKCHDHPFERWTQKNYWELAAYFAQVDRKDAPGSPKMPQLSATQTYVPAFEEIISDAAAGEVALPTGQVAAPSFPYHVSSASEAGATRAEIAELERRRSIAEWITSPVNPYFARSFVNRTWSYFLGVGLIDPVDDIRAGNPPSNPELLDRLAEDFIQSGFDVRKLIRLIVTSRVYAHSIETNPWNEDDSINFSHAIARRLPAETLYDAIHRATGSPTRLPGLRRGARAAEATPDVTPADGFLDLFGRPPRESACECERSSGMSLGQALNLVNGPTLAEAVRDPQNGITGLVALERDSRRVVHEIFLSTLSRPPSPLEEQEIVPLFDPLRAENADALPPEQREELARRLAAWETQNAPSRWVPLETALARSESGATLSVLDDGSILVSGENPERDRLTIVVSTTLTGITGLRLEVLPHENLSRNGPGRAPNGNFVLSEIRAAAVPNREPEKAGPVVFGQATQDFSQPDFVAAQSIDGKNDDQKGWAIAEGAGRAHVAVFETKENVGAEGGVMLTIVLDQQYGAQHSIGRFRLSATTSPRPVRLSALPPDVVDALLTPADQRSAEATIAIHRAYLATDGEIAQQIRLAAAQDLSWALMNSPAFLFNR
jgi:hypothetical protein